MGHINPQHKIIRIYPDNGKNNGESWGFSHGHIKRRPGVVSNQPEPTVIIRGWSKTTPRRKGTNRGGRLLVTDTQTLIAMLHICASEGNSDQMPGKYLANPYCGKTMLGEVTKISDWFWISSIAHLCFLKLL